MAQWLKFRAVNHDIMGSNSAETVYFLLFFLFSRIFIISFFVVFFIFSMFSLI